MAMVDSEIKAEVHALVFQEASGGDGSAWDRLTGYPDRGVDELEGITRVWGFTYGLTYGLLAARRPREPEAARARRAQELAIEVFMSDDGLLPDLELLRLMESARLAFEKNAV